MEVVPGRAVPVSLSGKFGSFVGWGPFDQLDSFDIGTGGSTHLRNTWEICLDDKGKLEYLAPDFSAVLCCENGKEVVDKVHMLGEKCITAYGKWCDSHLQEDDESRTLDKATVMLMHVIYGHSHRELGQLAQGLIDWYTLYQDMLESPQSSMAENVNPDKSWSAIHLSQWYSRCEAEGEKFRLYWDCCLRCAALGFDVALVELLKLHTSYRSISPTKQQETEVELLQLAMALIESRPRLASMLPYDPHTDSQRHSQECSSWDEFASMLEGFNGQISVIRQDHVFEEAKRTNPTFTQNVERILLVLSGKLQPLEDSTHGWVELFVGQLKSRRTDVTPGTLPNLVLECMNAKESLCYKKGPRPWLLELLMVSVQFDVKKVLECLMDCNIPLSPMCRVHSAALLTKHEYVRAAWLIADPCIGVSRMERYCMEVACSIDDWAVAFEYLSGCPKGRKGAMMSRLDTLQVGGEGMPLHVALEVCTRAGLPEYRNRLLHEHGVRLIRRGELGESLSCLIRSRDFQLSKVVLNKILDDVKAQLDIALHQDKLSLPALPYEDWLESIIDAARECAFDSPLLAFFVSYANLRKNLDEILFGCPDASGRAKIVQKGFLSILEGKCLPQDLEVHFIALAWRVRNLFPEVLHVMDLVPLAANLDEAAKNDSTASRVLHQFRIELCELLQTEKKL